MRRIFINYHYHPCEDLSLRHQTSMPISFCFLCVFTQKFINHKSRFHQYKQHAIHVHVILPCSMRVPSKISSITIQNFILIRSMQNIYIFSHATKFSIAATNCRNKHMLGLQHSVKKLETSQLELPFPFTQMLGINTYKEHAIKILRCSHDFLYVHASNNWHTHDIGIIFSSGWHTHHNNNSNMKSNFSVSKRIKGGSNLHQQHHIKPHLYTFTTTYIHE